MLVYNCMLIGDSLAVGVSQQINCMTVHAKVGDSTAAVLHKNPLHYSPKVTLISVGSNDTGDQSAQYQKLRDRIDGTVIWVLPAKQHYAREAILALALKRGDQIIDAKPYVGKDGVHPSVKGYQYMADHVRSNLSRQLP